MSKAKIVVWSSFSEEQLRYNGGYHHPQQNQKASISKDGVTITLDQDEIVEFIEVASGRKINAGELIDWK